MVQRRRGGAILPPGWTQLSMDNCVHSRELAERPRPLYAATEAGRAPQAGRSSA
jgi:hypothetical protein